MGVILSVINSNTFLFNILSNIEYYLLNEALGGIEVMLQSGVGRLLKQRLLTAKNIVESALKRSHSVGAHF